MDDMKNTSRTQGSESVRTESFRTGHDWGSSQGLEMRNVSKYTVVATVPAGCSLTVQQAVGHCGRAEVRAELFRFLMYDGAGDLRQVQYAE